MPISRRFTASGFTAGPSAATMVSGPVADWR
jgi:uncharacterized membrane protein YraQ (UPF0718 family)